MRLSQAAFFTLTFAILNGLMATGAETYARHGLVEEYGDYAAELYLIAARFQMWHALAMIGLAAFYDRAEGLAAKFLMWSAWSFGLGIILFSWTFYLFPFGGPIEPAPLGGIVLFLGWVLFGLAGWKMYRG